MVSVFVDSALAKLELQWFGFKTFCFRQKDSKSKSWEFGNFQKLSDFPACLFLSLDQIDSEQTRHSIASLQRLRMATKPSHGW